MSPYGITGPPDQSSRNSGSKFRLAKPPTTQILSRSNKKVCEISVVEKIAPGKVGQSLPRSLDLSSIDRPYTSLYRHSVVTLALDRFVSEIAGFVLKIPFCTYRLGFHQKWRCFPRVRSMSSVVQ